MLQIVVVTPENKNLKITQTKNFKHFFNKKKCASVLNIVIANWKKINYFRLDCNI